MKRTITISEEFGVWRIATSVGHEAAGATPAIAFTNLLIAAGVNTDDEFYEHVGWSAGGKLKDVFELALPKQEGRPDVPASTVR